ncbi:MAG: hypothetical protein GWP47_10165 [Actinobacteria bacterium]|nr:hypothetical protein [Actinomycetota bacterium]NCG38601.1 hypothetical protein [Actinomycetota bacterium]
MPDMMLAELQVFHSRPIAPTRRLALGFSTLPCDPAPGFGGVLLGAVAARFTPEVDPDLWPDLVSLTHEVEAARRVSQPRLRHRLQEDRIGLTRSSHRLFRNDQGILRATFNAEKGAPAQHVLGAIYAVQDVPVNLRGPVLGAVRRGLAWLGDIGPDLLLHLSGKSASSCHADAVGDPIGWAMGVLGISALDQRPEKAQIQRQFREALIDAHPDHGGDDGDAARRIADLSEARRILLTS